MPIRAIDIDGQNRNSSDLHISLDEEFFNIEVDTIILANFDGKAGRKGTASAAALKIATGASGSLFEWHPVVSI